jgi:hypothetical protein
MASLIESLNEGAATARSKIKEQEEIVKPEVKIHQTRSRDFTSPEPKNSEKLITVPLETDTSLPLSGEMDFEDHKQAILNYLPLKFTSSYQHIEDGDKRRKWIDKFIRQLDDSFELFDLNEADFSGNLILKMLQYVAETEQVSLLYLDPETGFTVKSVYNRFAKWVGLMYRDTLYKMLLDEKHYEVKVFDEDGRVFDDYGDHTFDTLEEAMTFLEESKHEKEDCTYLVVTEEFKYFDCYELSQKPKIVFEWRK